MQLLYVNFFILFKKYRRTLYQYRNLDLSSSVSNFSGPLFKANGLKIKFYKNFYCSADSRIPSFEQTFFIYESFLLKKI